MNDQQHANEIMLEQHKLARNTLDRMQKIAPWIEDSKSRSLLEEINYGLWYLENKVQHLEEGSKSFVEVTKYVQSLYQVPDTSINKTNDDALTTHLFGSS